MIRIFGATDTNFITNGDIVLQPFKAKVVKIDNGDFRLEIEASTDYLEYFAAGNIIVANTPQGNQAFRIRNTVKTEYKITATCWHVSYDLFYNYFVYELPLNTYVESISNLLSRLPSYLSPTYDTFPFTLSTDSASTGAFNYSNKTVFDILSDIASRFDLHMVRNNFNFALNTSIGTDRGVNIRYGVNLKEISKTEKWDNVCTICFPIGKEGARMIGGGYRESATQYDLKYTKLVNFAQENIKREYYNSDSAYRTALQTDLAVVAQQYVDKYCLPEVSYEFKAHLDGITDVGDTIRVIDETLGIDMLTQVKSYEYDCITERYTDLAFGNQEVTAKGLGKSVVDVFIRQLGGIIGDKQIVFGDNGALSWVTRDNT